MYTIPKTCRFLLFCLALSCLVGTHCALAKETDSNSELAATTTPRTVQQLRALQEQVRDIVDQARKATVAIEYDDAIGSGVVVSPDGLILSAGHVCMEPNSDIWIRFADNTRVRGMTLGVNHPVDSGMAKIIVDPPDDSGWPHLQVAKKPAEPGEWVVALGQPNGFIAGRAPPVRLGRVLSIDEESINTDAALVGGDSGGPLLNLHAEVVGIHSSIGERVTSNFHVAIQAFLEEWDRLIEGHMTGVPDGEDPAESRPMVGMAVRFVDGLCVVTQVFPDGAAEEAGIEVGDQIVRIGRHVPTDNHALAIYVNQQEAYDRIPIEYLRNDESHEAQLWLGRGYRPFPGAEPQEELYSGAGSTP